VSAGRSSLSSFLAPLLEKTGVDTAILYALLYRGWTVISGPVTLYLLTRALSGDEQGFYYTFASVLGLQVFFELGLGMVVVQFVSHEKAHLDWTERGTLEGDARARSRLSSLLQRTAKWYAFLATAFALFIVPAGFYFFAHHQQPHSLVNWGWPWVFVALCSAIGLLGGPFLFVIEGCGLIARVAKVRFYQNIATSLLFWLALKSGWGLWSGVIPSLASTLWDWGWLWKTQRALLLDLMRHPVLREAQVDWKREIWPLQWKIALSWLSSYFIFSLFNPVLFAFRGASEAGRMGMSVTMATVMWTTAFSWVSTKSAPFGSLVAKREFAQLDRLFFKSLWQSTALVVAGAVTLLGAVLYLNWIGHPWHLRVLAPLPFALLLAATIVNQIVAAQGLYLRVHKEEPFLGLSLLNGALVGVSTYVLGRFFGATGMMAGYFVISLVAGLGLGTWIFIRKRRQWHREQEGDFFGEPLVAPSLVASSGSEVGL